MTNIIESMLGTILAPIQVPYSYWVVKLDRPRKPFLSELDFRYDIKQGKKIPYDWTMQLVDGGDTSKIKELWLMCPPHVGNPLGTTACIPIIEKNTAFQFKVGTMFGLLESAREVTSQVIGRVDDK